MEYKISNHDEILVFALFLQSALFFMSNLYIDRVLILYDDLFKIHILFSLNNYCFGFMWLLILFRFYEIKNSSNETD